MGRAGLRGAMDVCGLCLILGTVLALAAENPSQLDTLGVVQLFLQFRDIAVVKDVNRDPMFECLRVISTEYDEEAQSATYDWSLNVGNGKPRKHALVLYTPSDDTGTFITTVLSDPSNRAEARVIYTDNATCGISIEEIFGYQCKLFVAYENRYSYPEECNKMHTQLCGESVSLFDKELCNDTKAY